MRESDTLYVINQMLGPGVPINVGGNLRDVPIGYFAARFTRLEGEEIDKRAELDSLITKNRAQENKEIELLRQQYPDRKQYEEKLAQEAVRLAEQYTKPFLDLDNQIRTIGTLEGYFLIPIGKYNMGNTGQTFKTIPEDAISVDTLLT